MSIASLRYISSIFFPVAPIGHVTNIYPSDFVPVVVCLGSCDGSCFNGRIRHTEGDPHGGDLRHDHNPSEHTHVPYVEEDQGYGGEDGSLWRGRGWG